MSHPPPLAPPQNNDDIYYSTSNHHLHQQPHFQPSPPPITFNNGPSLLKTPARDHTPDNYEDMRLDHDPALIRCLEQYLPTPMLKHPRKAKADFLSSIIDRYLPRDERIRIRKQRVYRHRLRSSYTPLYKELYVMHAENFFVPSFLEAIRGKSEASLRRVVSEPFKGIFTFQMLQERFCDQLMKEVDHFEKHIRQAKLRIMRPNTMNKYGVVLDDFGMEEMLRSFMENFIKPVSAVFFADFGGATLDSHHGYVVEYGTNRDLDLGFHVDDAEVSLNVCLGDQFSGGELYFRGLRCDEHVNTEAQSDEIFDYSHVPGQAVLHCGRVRHGVRPTTSGHRLNLILWGRSSEFREKKRYTKSFPDWCIECKRQKKERMRLMVNAATQRIREMRR